MLIRINTDNHIVGREEMAARFEAHIENELKHFSRRISRVEAYFNDENSSKRAPDDKRCTLEARLEGHQPVAVTFNASTLDAALHGASDKLKHALDNLLGKMRERRDAMDAAIADELEGS